MTGCNTKNHTAFCLLAALLVALPHSLRLARAQEPIPLPPDQREASASEQGEPGADAEPQQGRNASEGEQADTPDEPASQQSAEEQAPTGEQNVGSGVGDEQSEEPATTDADAEPDGTPAEDAQAAPATEESGEQRGIRRLGDSLGTSSGWNVAIPAGIQQSERAEPAVDVSVPDQQLDSRLQEALVALARDSENATAQRQLEAILDEVGDRAAASIRAGRFGTAGAYLEAMRTLQPERSQLDALERQLEQARAVDALLEQGEAALAEGRLIEPADDNARGAFQRVLELEGDNQAANEGLAEVRQALVDRALSLGGESEFASAESLLDEAEAVPGDADVASARQRLDQLRVEYAADLQETVLRRIDNGDYQGAAEALDQLATLGGYSDQVRQLRASLADARAYGGFVPGQVFSDDYGGGSGSGPDMVVLPAGSFMMGAPPNQEPRPSYQRPYHLVRFSRGFAISRTEVTVGQFRDFVEATGYITDAERADGTTVYVERSGRMREEEDADWRDSYTGRPAEDDMPVVHVSWNDARAYAQWLAEVAGRSYRLPSEAEFEYALRGGTRTLYWWGNGKPPRNAMTNLTGEDDTSESGRSWNESFENYTDGYWGPAPVASFEPNPFGLYDMAGNIKEWTLDCWHSNYSGAPSDGSAWVEGTCSRRVVRGGDWASTPEESFSSVRLAAETSSRMPRLGFRVARDL